MPNLKRLKYSQITMNNKDLHISNLFRDSYKLLSQNSVKIYSIVFCGYGLSLIIPFLQLMDVQLKHSGWLIPFGLIWTLGVIAELCADMALILFCSAAFLGQEIQIGESFKKIKGVFWSYIFYSSLWGAIVVLGVIAGIFPGFYLGTIFSFVLLLSILDRGQDRSPFKLSRVLVQGYFWKAFLIHFIAMFVALSGPGILEESDQFSDRMTEFVFGLLGLLFVPVYPALMVPLFHKLKSIKEDSGELSDIRGHRWVGLKAFSGVVGLILIVVVPIGLTFWAFNRFVDEKETHPLFRKYVLTPMLKHSSPEDDVVFKNGTEIKFEWHWMIGKHEEKEEFYGNSISNDHIQEIHLGLMDKDQFKIIPSSSNMTYQSYVRKGVQSAKDGKDYGVAPKINTDLADASAWEHSWFVDDKDFKRHEYTLNVEENVIYLLISHPVNVDRKGKLNREIGTIEDSLSKIDRIDRIPGDALSR